MNQGNIEQGVGVVDLWYILCGLSKTNVSFQSSWFIHTLSNSPKVHFKEISIQNLEFTQEH